MALTGFKYQTIYTAYGERAIGSDHQARKPTKAQRREQLLQEKQRVNQLLVRINRNYVLLENPGRPLEGEARDDVLRQIMEDSRAIEHLGYELEDAA